MFYRPQDGHGLPHSPIKAIVAPRPIAWVSTRASDGTLNLAPYSFFNLMADTPPQLVFGSTGSKADQRESKDSVSNIRDTGVFCVNIVPQVLRDVMNVTTAPLPKEVDEFAKAGLTPAACEAIDCPRVAEAPASLECTLSEIIRLEGEANFMVLGKVVGIHMRDEYIHDGIFDITKVQPLTRLGYRDYSYVSEVFSLDRPDQS
ncbi:flavin reductase family protein [Cognatishimia sp. SS12]|uniref:flavin reductase family protein n=1 Tax=Cognatishimia sp. SS12 TaxID=2979465 RepID=UPI00232E7026|nr:flavin reductase family protein [Cognatishimia sp. SS12]MDC0736913.1 flavin reductase family protein [Cognatishimia sp. SS12]